MNPYLQHGHGNLISNDGRMVDSNIINGDTILRVCTLKVLINHVSQPHTCHTRVHILMFTEITLPPPTAILTLEILPRQMGLSEIMRHCLRSSLMNPSNQLVISVAAYLIIPVTTHGMKCTMKCARSVTGITMVRVA